MSNLNNMLNQEIAIEEIGTKILDIIKTENQIVMPLKAMMQYKDGWKVIYKSQEVGEVSDKISLYSRIKTKDLDNCGKDKKYQIKLIRQNKEQSGRIIYNAVIEKEIENEMQLYTKQGIFKAQITDIQEQSEIIKENKILSIGKIDKEKINLKYNNKIVGYILKDNQGKYEQKIYEKIQKQMSTKEYYFTATGNFDKDFCTVIVYEMDKIGEKELKNIKRVEEEGILTKDQIIPRVKYLRDNHITDKQIDKIFESMINYSEKEKIRIPKKPKYPFVDKENTLKMAISCINQNYNIMLEGHMGTGKNVLCETLAWLYNRPLYEFSMNSETGNFELLGSQTIKDGDIQFQESLVIEGFRKGGIIVFDEFNTTPPENLTIFNSMLDDRRRINVPSYNKNKSIEGHKNTTVIATQNPDYIGTYRANQATRNRFHVIQVPRCQNIMDIINPQLNKKLEAAEEYKVNKLYQGIINLVEQGELDSDSVNIRGLIRALQLYEENDDFELKDIITQSLVDSLVDSSSKEIIEKAINNIM